MILPALRRSPAAACGRGHQRRRAGDLDPRQLGAHRDLGLRLGAADADQRRGHGVDHRRVGGGRGAEVGGRRPRRAVDRALLPPRPDLLGDVGQERREQPQLDLQRERQGGPGRRGGGAAVLVVRPLLDQLEVVVAELPEEPLGHLERGRVVVGLERLGGLRSTTSASRPSRAQSIGSETAKGRARRADAAQDELRGVEHLHRQPAADLHLGLVERRVQAGAGHRGPPADRVRAVLLEDLGRDHDVALGLRHLLAVGVDDEAGDHRVRPGRDVVLEVRADHPARTARCG